MIWLEREFKLDFARECVYVFCSILYMRDLVQAIKFESFFFGSLFKYSISYACTFISYVIAAASFRQ